MYKTYALGGLAILVIIGLIADDLKTYDTASNTVSATADADNPPVVSNPMPAPDIAPQPSQAFGFEDTVSDYGKPMIDSIPDLNPGTEESEGTVTVTTPTPRSYAAPIARPGTTVGKVVNQAAVDDALARAKAEAMSRPVGP